VENRRRTSLFALGTVGSGLNSCIDGRSEKMFLDALRLIRFERCLVSFVSTQHEPDRLILAPEAVVTTVAAQSCVDRESLKCQRSRDAEGQYRRPGRAMTFPLSDRQQPPH
jgi:hypothetical protein